MEAEKKQYKRSESSDDTPNSQPHSTDAVVNRVNPSYNVSSINKNFENKQED